MKSEDNLAFDLTIQGCTKLNEVVPTYPNTYYFSEVTEQTTKYPFSDYHRPELRMNPALAAGAFYMGQFEFDAPPIAGRGAGLMEDKLWYQNDGCVSAISQQFPFTAGDHPVAAERLHDAPPFEKGEWYWDYAWGGSCDHGDIVFLYKTELGKTANHEKLYIDLYERLASLD